MNENCRNRSKWKWMNLYKWWIKTGNESIKAMIEWISAKIKTEKWIKEKVLVKYEERKKWGNKRKKCMKKYSLGKRK